MNSMKKNETEKSKYFIFCGEMCDISLNAKNYTLFSATISSSFTFPKVHPKMSNLCKNIESLIVKLHVYLEVSH